MRSHLWFYVAGLLVCCVPLVMRLAVIDAFPSTDEGYYAFHAMLAHDGLGNSGRLYPLGPLHLYPLLCSFVFSWEINPIIALRLCDMVVAALLAWQWFRLMEQESESLLAGFCIALAVVFAFNLPVFAQHGFKNSLSISFIFFIAALRVGLGNQEKTAQTWLICGLLTAIGVFFREALLPFAAVGFVGIWVAHGRRAAVFYATGGFVSVLLMLAALALARGGLGNIIEAYSTFGAMARESGRFNAPNLMALKSSLKSVAFLTPLLLGCVFVAVRSKIPHGHRVLFWGAVAVVPLLEVLTKGGWPYHFATCLLGLSGLTACLFCVGGKSAPRVALCAVVTVFAVSLFFALPQAKDASRNAGQALRRLPERLLQADFPADMVSQSNYLLMAQAVKNAAKSGDTLMTSGHYHVLYPLTGLLPPKTDNHLFDLGLLALARQLSPDALHVRILLESPDFIVLSQRSGTGADVLEQALSLLPQYQRIAEIPIDSTKDYGGFSGIVYAKNKSPYTSPARQE
jgi:hypothetical protein